MSIPEGNRVFISAKVEHIEHVLTFLQDLLDKRDALKVVGIPRDAVVEKINCLRSILSLEPEPFEHPAKPYISVIETTSKWDAGSMEDSFDRVFRLKRVMRESIDDDHYDLTITSRHPERDRGMWRVSGLGFSLAGLRCLASFVPNALETLHPDSVTNPNPSIRAAHVALVNLVQKHPVIQEDAKVVLDTLYIGGSRV